MTEAPAARVDAGSDPGSAAAATTAGAQAEPVSDRLLTIPNALSALRLAGVPLFLWLLLGPHADGLALLVLMLSGVTDYLDGKLARMLHQTSKLGTLLDPAADRLYIFATVLALTIRGIIPWWLTAALVLRDLVLLATLPALKRIGYGPLPVHWLGKSATFCLLYAFPLLLIGAGSNELATICRPIAWAFTLWGTALYWWSGVLYLIQTRQLLREAKNSPNASRKAAPA
jgi:CDP-diacylglycerol--glycerol-3-phosphate 3-phosphatidyltransferase